MRAYNKFQDILQTKFGVTNANLVSMYADEKSAVAQARASGGQGAVVKLAAQLSAGALERIEELTGRLEDIGSLAAEDEMELFRLCSLRDYSARAPLYKSLQITMLVMVRLLFVAFCYL